MSRAPSTSSGHLSCRSFDQISSFSVVIAPMRIVPPSSRMPLSSGNPAEVDQVTRLGEAHLHHRQQAVAAGEQLRLVAELREQAERVGDGLRRVILEIAGNHRSLLQRSWCERKYWPNAPQQYKRHFRPCPEAAAEATPAPSVQTGA